MRKILILAENDGGAGEREGRGGDGDSNEVIGAGGGVLLVIGLGGVLGRADDDDGGGAFLLDTGDGTVSLGRYFLGNGLRVAKAVLYGRITGRSGGDGGSNIMGLLALTVVAQQDIAIGADGIGKGIVGQGDVKGTFLAVVYEADGRRIQIRSFAVFVEPQLLKVLFSMVTVIVPDCLCAILMGAQLLLNSQFLITMEPSAVVWTVESA